MIQHDKLLHFAAGILAFAAILPFTGPWFAFAVASLAAVGKEAYDHLTGKGTPELLDAAATVAGGGVGVWIAYF